ncbi:hypothetical protein PSYPI_48510, partial [Pseudomonas syringae pv. pisi str. 1704B]
SPRPISGIGPFVFDSDEYRRIIIEAPVHVLGVSKKEA